MKFDSKFFDRLFSPDVEGERFKAYKDSVGVWTLGAGTTEIDGKPVVEGMTCTHEQALTWATKDSEKFEKIVNNTFAKRINEFTQGMFDACGLFCYNEGSFAKAKTLAGVLNGNPTDFEHIISVWKKYSWGHNQQGVAIQIPGLLRRRKYELYLYIGDKITPELKKLIEA